MRLYLTSEISTIISMNEEENFKDFDVNLLPILLKLMNFFEIHVLNSDFNILKTFICILILNL